MITRLDRLDSTTRLVTDAIWAESIAEQAVRHAEREAAAALHLADRDLAIDLAGLGLRQWHGLMDGTATVTTPADGCDLVHAHHQAKEIEAAISHCAEVASTHGSLLLDAKVRRSAARRVVKRLLGPDPI